MKNIFVWLALACIPVYGFFTIPFQAKLQDKQSQVKALEVEKNSLITELKSLQDKQKQLAKDPSASERLLKRIPLTLNQEFILIDLQKISEKSGFFFKSLNFGKSTNRQVKAPEIVVKFSVQGQHEKMPELLKAIEENERFMGLKTLNFNTKLVNQQKILQMNLSVYAFAQTTKE